MKIFIFKVVAFTALLLVLRCAPEMAGVGTGEETTNGLVYGLVVDSCSHPVKGAIVMLTLALNDPVRDASAILRDTTDSIGGYHFNTTDSGVYNVESFCSGRALSAMVTLVDVGFDTVEVTPLNLSAPGSIRIRLIAGANTSTGYVYLPGTDIFTYLNAVTDWITFDSVPSVHLPSIAYAASKNTAATVIRYDVDVVPGGTAFVYNPSWSYAKNIFLNTTSSGADITNGVNNFPVLVKLNAGNFNFTQAKTGGDDLRFTKDDGTPLPFEIARWDGAAQEAEIWVKADTIRGNDSSQYMTMYWGDPVAGPESSSMMVFDSASGFEGVWHLNETSGTIVRDASHNGFTGTYKGGLPRCEPGLSGICQNITRPDTDYIEMGNVLNPGMRSFSIGVWLKRKTLNTQQAFIAKTNGGNPSSSYGYLFNFDASNLAHLYIATGSGGNWFSDSVFEISSNLTITDTTTWHYLIVTVNRSANTLCKMYIDGVDRTGVIGGDVTTISAISNSLNLCIGTESDHNYSFSGSIGEVTIAFAARSADWVKLSYTNQKDSNRLVILGKE
jgi:hypothetical protein